MYAERHRLWQSCLAGILPDEQATYPLLLHLRQQPTYV